MDIKVIVATHKTYQFPEENIYFPIQVGAEDKIDLGYQKDNTGNHISSRNGNYCELTALYWAWKNMDSDYIGLSHYRRYFTNESFSTILKKRKIKPELILTEEQIVQKFKEFDIILPIKRNYYIETVWDHYKNAHNITDLEQTREIIEELHPSYIADFDFVMNQKKLHLYNMFIVNKKEFDEYSEWLFSILFELEKRVDISDYDSYQSRIFGFISERLFNVWVNHKQYSICELNVINLEKVNWGGKVTSFLMRKIK